MEITAAEFRKNCFKILDAVHQTRKEVVITKRGKPIARLVSYEEVPKADPLIGSLLGQGETVGDLTEPLEDVWELD
ncbi:MAG: type II toxin-antitoxin system Phd/YefM family antitoxin [Deltaproteobacteria bacterium]|nr:type II toxin-antitoxin system Phd/YefM family antitoxin [Deltaproteobacteria bacterium]MBW2072182.1 type II toxin-antitoxin system Phd/YefM family antitoxin [Deltaproteobacteria bacterium]